MMRIHELTAIQLRAKLDAGEVSSVEIVESLQQRASLVNPRVNAIVDEYSEEALEAAHRADDERARGVRKGPLHGMPITVKENLDVAGKESTLGFTSWRGHPAETDAVVVRALRENGAVILGKTNVPQSLMSPLETTNGIWGQTNNPWDLDRACGGSSGGEAVSLATGLSPLGIGTDVGGSIRLPAAFCGVAGLKPTATRWSNVGSRSTLPGQEFMRAQTGPMARTAADVAFLFRALGGAQQNRYDGTVPPLPDADPAAVDVTKLRVGIYDTDGFMEPSPGVIRAVGEARKALRAAGITVVDYPPPHASELLYLYLAAISSDGGATITKALDGEAIIDPLKLVRLAAEMPWPARKALARTLALTGEKRTARLLDAVGEKSVADFWALAAERDRYGRLEAAAWDQAGIDAVVCPAQFTPAVPHGMGKDFILSFTYVARYNMLNLPAGVVPVTCVRHGEEVRERIADRVDRRAAAVEAKSDGMPLGVQVVGRPWREDVVLALMAKIEDGVRDHPDFPKTPITPGGHSEPPPAPKRSSVPPKP